MLPGDSFPLKREEGIDNSGAIVVCLSPDYLESDSSAADRAAFIHADPQNKKRTVIPVTFRDCALPRTIAHLMQVDYRNPSEDAVTQIVNALTAHPEGLGQTITPAPRPKQPCSQRPRSEAWHEQDLDMAQKSMFYHRITQEIIRANYDWKLEPNHDGLEALRAALEEETSAASAYLQRVVQGARLALSLSEVIHDSLPREPTTDLPPQLRRAYYLACRVWLDYEWGTIFEYAFAITQVARDRTRSAILRSLLIFAISLLHQRGHDPSLCGLFEWAQANGIGEVAFANGLTNGLRPLGECRLIVEFLPSSPRLRPDPPKSVRGQLWLEDTFVGDAVEIELETARPDAIAEAVAELSGADPFVGTYHSIDLVLPASLLTFDTADIRVPHPGGGTVPIDRIAHVHRRFGERLWHTSEVETVTRMYQSIISSHENVRLMDSVTIGPADLFDTLRRTSQGIVFAAECTSSSEFGAALLASVRATPICVWSIDGLGDIGEAVREYWPQVPDAVRRGRASPRELEWAQGAHLLCIWEDTGWLTIANRISSYDEEGIA